VEENNFGIRKRLLEYDDVMNKQRGVIYARRNHALFGDRLALDLDNAFYSCAEGLVNSFKENNDFEGFKLGAIVDFSIDTKIDKEDFSRLDHAKLSELLYEEARTTYFAKSADLSKHALPVFQSIRTKQGNHIENVYVPFSDGKRALQIHSSMQKNLNTGGKELVNSLERTITLNMIDDSWKEHLRSMDDLKQSVQSAVYEQKDPLVIYKVEAFSLFKQMDTELNKNIVSFLCHAGIVSESQQHAARTPQIKETPKVDLSKLRQRKDELVTTGPVDAPTAQDPEYFDPSGPVKQEPIKVGPKVGRNDPCPCGSGKKFKNCHGKDA
jgi:preprotein translocase subunit SecA